ncbi:uncharacterized protein LOC106875835 [Octopus bimaculoides]|uniref:uncharacterized protein LOC106875835 n=1 Tax=Octopus bimaculoides TaxID=37653 RepID=UPI00071C5C02|nr:uncharacterized protein LOC106875835 [Octopus bimaculoides]|eukprot:XP_014779612.1 PREDICTED: uncharacterized protein LOC106875835 [Octopus bimaculoides]
MNILQCIRYDEHQWQLCGDLKVVAFVMGLQGGYTKYCCFLCEWDNRTRGSHYTRRDWPLRQSLEPGMKNVQHPPLTEPNKILLPLLHIKLRLMKNFVKAMEKLGQRFKYLTSKFPTLSDAKIKGGIFIDPQIRELLKDDDFESALHRKKKAACEPFKLVAKRFLGNRREGNYKELMEKLIKAYKDMDCNMSLKIHFLDSHLDIFRRAVGQLVTNIMKGFPKIFQPWKSGTRVNGTQQCLQTITGHWQEMIHQPTLSVKQKRRVDMCYVFFCSLWDNKQLTEGIVMFLRVYFI